ncbi:PQQ-binding-like beta-propeller repeat protein [Planctomycetota bacterium]
MRFRSIATAIAAVLTLQILPLQAEPHSSTWNQFRGPNGSGVAEDCRPPVVIDAEKATWKIDVPPGHSSPVLSQKLLFLTAVEGDRLVTLAFKKQTGELVWRKEAPEAPMEKVHEASSPAASTPYIDEDHVYVYFGSYGLLSYDLEGRDQWDRPIPTPRSLYGTSSSPIVHGDSLILVVDNGQAANSASPRSLPSTSPRANWFGRLSAPFIVVVGPRPPFGPTKAARSWWCWVMGGCAVMTRRLLPSTHQQSTFAPRRSCSRFGCDPRMIGAKFATKSSEHPSRRGM